MNIIPKHKLLVISINKSISEGSEIYDAVRWAWKLNPERAKECEFVLAHQSGKIVGVFKADEWLPATDPIFSNLGQGDEGRWGFIGQVAPSEILMEYFNKELPKGFTKKGASNPVRFLDPVTENIVDQHKSDFTATADASIDNEGYFYANIDIDISNAGAKDDVIHVDGDVISKIAGEKDISMNSNNSEVEYGSLSLGSGWVKLDEGVNPDYQIETSLKVFRFRPPQVFECELPKNNQDISLEFSKGNNSISKVSFEWDEDDDSYGTFTFLTSGDSPHGFSLGVGKEEDKEFINSSYYITDSNESEFQEGVWEAKVGQKMLIYVQFGDLLNENLQLRISGSAEVMEREEIQVEDYSNDIDPTISEIIKDLKAAFAVIISSNKDFFISEQSCKIRNDLGEGKWYLDWVDGSYEDSLPGLIHHMMWADGHYHKFLDDDQLKVCESVVVDQPTYIYAPDEDETQEKIDQIQWEVTKFVGSKLLSIGMDVSESFADYEIDDIDFSDDFDNNSQTPFIFNMPNDYLFEALTDNGVDALKELFRSNISAMVNAIIDYVDQDARFFLLNENKNAFELFPEDIDAIFDEIDLNSKESIESYFPQYHYQLTAVVDGANHWDSGFLRVSAEEGTPDFYVWGFYPPIGQIATQGYCDGEYDTGIVVYPNDEDSYSGEERMESSELTQEQFELSFYDIE